MFRLRGGRQGSLEVECQKRRRVIITIQAGKCLLRRAVCLGFPEWGKIKVT